MFFNAVTFSWTFKFDEIKPTDFNTCCKIFKVYQTTLRHYALKSKMVQSSERQLHVQS